MRAAVVAAFGVAIVAVPAPPSPAVAVVTSMTPPHSTVVGVKVDHTTKPPIVVL